MNEQIKLVVYYLAQKEGDEIKGLSDGPYVSIELARKDRTLKYKWKANDYEIVQTEQLFIKSVIKIKD
jgi:hypothetical protein